MPDYKKLYSHLMHETAEVIEKLIKVQQECEQILLDDEEETAAASGAS